jgi:hypothetical protein
MITDPDNSDIAPPAMLGLNNSSFATVSAVRRLSPVAMTSLMPSRCRSAMASRVVSLIGSATAISPARRPSMPT